MSELVKNIDLKAYCSEISTITGIDSTVLEKLIVYIIEVSGLDNSLSTGEWFDRFEEIVSGIISVTLSSQPAVQPAQLHV